MALLPLFISLLLGVWVYMTLWFGVAKLTDRADLIDSAWSLGFVYVAWLAWALTGAKQGIRLLSAEFVTLWGIRLFLHIFLRNKNKPEDRRYITYRERWGDGFWQQAYFRIFLVQAILLLAVSSTVVASMVATASPWLWLTVVGFAVWIFGMIFEAEADAELARFIKTKKPGQIMQTGLWRYSRHPNYFGEITTWWGAALVALSLRQWWGIIGALVITILITKVSGVPLLEKHYADNAEFKKYKKRTSVLIPWLPRR